MTGRKAVTPGPFDFSTSADLTGEQVEEFRQALASLPPDWQPQVLRTGFPYLLCHAIVQVPPEMDVPDEHRAGIEITVTSAMDHPVRADIADRIREAIWSSMREPEQ